MSCGDAVGWETSPGQVGIPTTPGRAPRYFFSSNSKETSSKPLVGDLHSQPGSVPAGMAVGSSGGTAHWEWQTFPGLQPAWISLCSSCPSCPYRALGSSFPGPEFVPASMGTLGRAPPWARNTSEKWLLAKAASPSPNPARRGRQDALPLLLMVSLGSEPLQSPGGASAAWRSWWLRQQISSGSIPCSGEGWGTAGQQGQWGMGAQPCAKGLGALRWGCVCLLEPGDLGASPPSGSGSISTVLLFGNSCPLPGVISGAK